MRSTKTNSDHKEQPSNSETNINSTAKNNDQIDFQDVAFGPFVDGGSFGKVYSGLILSKHQTVAIKKININPKKTNEENKYRAEHEIKILKKLNDADKEKKYIVNYFGYTINGNEYYILMEKMQDSLSNFIEKNPEKDNQFKYKIINAIANGIDFLHRQLIVHCDIKTENILLSQIAEDDLQIKICDFGLSNYIFNINSGVGSMVYNAPELLIENKSNNFKTDIHSTSIVFWEVFAWSNKPYDQIQSEREFFAFIKKGGRESINPDWPQKIQLILKWMWAKDPEKRPSAKELVTAVKSDLKFVSARLTQLNFWTFASKSNLPLPTITHQLQVLSLKPKN